MDSNTTHKELLDTFQWATKAIKICPNRLWGVAGKELPKLMPDRGALEGHGGSAELDQNHEMCTFEFCEFSQRDFTAVRQRHECKDNNCFLLRDLFSRETLRKAAENDTSTVWSLDGRSMINRPRPHMAVSHVWSDGTGTGAWLDGEVNECLYRFFKRIAQHFQCEGIWWDTICIPREKAARNKAIRKIQSNYESARITLVHDCFLRNWNWDPKTACFAILMSPWFSRGWTALELAKSPKVKVIFKGPCGLLIKDLDEDILSQDDKDDKDEPRIRASRIIRDLRKPITSINSLLKILSSRFTSWPKDKAIIAALLVNLDLQGEVWQQDVYKRILIKMRKISSGHLFHNSATMSNAGWCPTSLFQMPSADEAAESQYVAEDLSLTGKWRPIPATAIPAERYIWRGIHPLVREELQFHLKDATRCWLLIESQSSAKPSCVSIDRALMVKKLEEQSKNSSPSYTYIGAIYFQPQALTEQDLSKGDVEVKLLGDTTHNGTALKAVKEQLGDNVEPVWQDSVLHDAIWRRDYERFNNIIITVDLDLSDQLGQRLIHLAAERGDFGLVQRLLGRKDVTKSIIDARCDLGQTALHRACWGGSVAIVDSLIEHKADISIKDDAGNLPLHFAAEKGFEFVVDRIIDKSDCAAANQNLVTPLHYAAWSGNKSIVSRLLKKGANLEAEDKHGWSPLHYAAESGQKDIVRYFLEKGAEVNKKDSKVGWTALHFAEFNAYQEVVELLCKSGADIEATDKSGWTPRQLAVLRDQAASNVQLVPEKSPASDQRTEIRELLPEEIASPYLGLASFQFDYGAPNILGDRHWTPLHSAAINEGQMVAKLLLDEDLYTTYDNKGEWSVLSWAAHKGQTAVMRLLLQNGAGVNSVDKGGQTPLSRAAVGGHLAVVRLLFENGVKADLNHSGVEALLCAASNGYDAVVSFLHAKGVDIALALFTAVRYGKVAALELLLDMGLADVNMKAREWYHGCPPSTLLEVAITYRNVAAVEFLLNKGASHDFDFIDPYPLLLKAIEAGNVDIVKTLLDHGALARYPYGRASRPPLSAALRKFNCATFALLLERGAKFKLRLEKGDYFKLLAEKDDKLYLDGQPLSRTPADENINVVKYLIQQGDHVTLIEGNDEERLSDSIKPWDTAYLSILHEIAWPVIYQSILDYLTGSSYSWA